MCDFKQFNERMTVTDNVYSVDKASKLLLSQLIIKSKSMKFDNPLGISPNIVDTPRYWPIINYHNVINNNIPDNCVLDIFTDENYMPSAVCYIDSKDNQRIFRISKGSIIAQVTAECKKSQMS